MYALCYTVHEVSHFANPSSYEDHGEHFRTVEQRALGHWGIVDVEYGETYASRFGTAYGHVLNRYGNVVGGKPW